MNTRPLGILDSGVGGLSIWQEITSLLPHESTIYLADSLNCPYGPRTPEEILPLSRSLIHILLQQDVKLIVIACNTITVTCLDALRREFPEIPIIGTVPVIKTAAERTQTGSIGILSTKRTAASTYQQQLIARFAAQCQVTSVGTDALVPFVERGEIESVAIQDVLSRDLQPFLNTDIDVVALGCTHFPFLKEPIASVLGSQVLLLDSGKAVARQIQRVLAQEQVATPRIYKPTYTFLTTGEKTQFQQVIQMLISDLSVSSIAHVSDVA